MVLDSKTTDILFNSSGRAFDYVAERLKEERKRLGKDLNAPMSVEEKERNVLFVFQIPLKQKEIKKDVEKIYLSSGSYFPDSYDKSFLESSTVYNQSYGITNSTGQLKSVGKFNEKKSTNSTNSTNSTGLFNFIDSNNLNDIEDTAINLSNQSRGFGSAKKTVKKMVLVIKIKDLLKELEVWY